MRRAVRNMTGFSTARVWKKPALLCKTEKMLFFRKKRRKSSTNTPFPSLKYIEGLFKSMGNAAFQTLLSHRDCGADAHLDK